MLSFLAFFRYYYERNIGEREWNLLSSCVCLGVGVKKGQRIFDNKNNRQQCQWKFILCPRGIIEKE